VEEHAGFLPVEIVDAYEEPHRAPERDAPAPAGRIELELAGGHRLRITGPYDPEALARLIRGLTT
jgi:transposase